jgi:hypothetical protein
MRKANDLDSLNPYVGEYTNGYLVFFGHAGLHWGGELPKVDVVISGLKASGIASMLKFAMEESSSGEMNVYR